jgi:hypothetical protein
VWNSETQEKKPRLSLYQKINNPEPFGIYERFMFIWLEGACHELGSLHVAHALMLCLPIFLLQLASISSCQQLVDVSLVICSLGLVVDPPFGNGTGKRLLLSASKVNMLFPSKVFDFMSRSSLSICDSVFFGVVMIDLEKGQLISSTGRLHAKRIAGAAETEIPMLMIIPTSCGLRPMPSMMDQLAHFWRLRPFGKVHLSHRQASILILASW